MAHLYFRGTTEKDPLTYTVGEEILFHLCLTSNGTDTVPCDTFRCKIQADGAEAILNEYPGTTGEVTVRTSCSMPGFVFVTLEACDADGNPLPDCEPYDGGAGADIHKITHAVDEPADFSEFWEQVIREELDPVTPAFLMKKEVPISDPDSVLYDIRVAAPGPCAASGYLRMPKNAAPGSLPIRTQFLGYGVGSACIPEARDCIAVCINQHGTENGREEAYYLAEHDTTLCRDFAFNTERNQTPDSCDFKYLLLRDLQVVRLLKTLPEWNGRDVICGGGSMGAFQSTFIGAFDPDVSLLNLSIPWMCDVDGVSIGRTPGWRPDFLPCMNYYDTVNFARRLHCPVTIYAGLGDTICPPSGIMALYREIPTEKTLQFAQDANHGRSGPASILYTV